MSKLPTEAVKEFAKLFKQVYGIDLDEKEAALRAGNLLNLYRAVLGTYGSGDMTGNE